MCDILKKDLCFCFVNEKAGAQQRMHTGGYEKCRTNMKLTNM